MEPLQNALSLVSSAPKIDEGTPAGSSVGQSQLRQTDVRAEISAYSHKFGGDPWRKRYGDDSLRG